MKRPLRRKEKILEKLFIEEVPETKVNPTAEKS
jgi:hypothetical protein